MDIRFTITNPQHYEEELIKAYETITDRKLYPADPERLLLNVIAYITSLLAFNIDWSAKQNLLSFAEGSYLDALAELYGIQRLPAQKAKVKIRFYTDSPVPVDITIPRGTRAAAGNVIFETLQETRIPAGQTQTEIDAECQTAGTVGNGLTAGQINQLLDPLPYGVKVVNITTSLFGADTEDDERFRERIRLSIERFSNAGSRQAYIYHTLSAHPLIEDVQVVSPAPGQVKVYFLMQGGEIPTQEIIDIVSRHLNDEKIRPLTDQVFVEAPGVITYQINVKYWINKKDEGKVFFIQQSIQKSIEEFIREIGSKIGKDVLPEEIIQRVRNAGAYKIEVITPSRIEIPVGYVAKGEIQTIQYMGLSDD